MMWSSFLFIFMILPFGELAGIIVLVTISNQRLISINKLKQQAILLHKEGKISDQDLLRFGFKAVPKTASPASHSTASHPAASNAPEVRVVTILRKNDFPAAVTTSAKEVPLANGSCTNSVSDGVSATDFVNASPTADAHKTPETPVKPPRFEHIQKEMNRGLLPLVIGVIFVILSGLIFATTSWQLIPDLGKVLLILAGAITFFSASFLADRKLHIEKTSKACYILGSIFLFSTVLACGSFGLLGPTLTPLGDDQFALFFIGMLVLEAALFRGLKLFQGRFYASACLYGVTVTAVCFILSFHPGNNIFAATMAIYALTVVLSERVFRTPKLQSLANLTNLIAVYPTYKLLNLWFVSLFILLRTSFGVLSVISVLLIGCAHFYLQNAEEKNRGGFYAFSALLFAGLLLASSHGLMLIYQDVTPAQIIGMTILTADITLMAYKHQKMWLIAMQNLISLMLVHHIVFYFDLALRYRLLGVTVAAGMLYLLGYVFRHLLKCLIGDIIYLSVMLLNVLLLIDLSLIGTTGALSALTLMAAAFFATMVYLIGKEQPQFTAIKQLFPPVAGLVTIPLWELANLISSVYIIYSVVLFAYLIALMLWDLCTKNNYEIAIISIATAASVFGLIAHQIQPPYLLCLAIYLSVKLICRSTAVTRKTVQEKEKKRAETAAEKEVQPNGTAPIYYHSMAGFSLPAGAVIAMLQFSRHILMQTFLPASVLAVGYVILTLIAGCAVFMMLKREYQSLLFAGLMGNILYAVFMIGSYFDGSFFRDSLNPWYLAVAVAAFIAIYALSYLHGPSPANHLHLLSAVVTLMIPIHLYVRYGMTDHRLYATTFIVLAVFALISRYFFPILEKKSDGYRVDWFLVLQPAVILPMTFMATDLWQFVYILGMAGYTLQYYGIQSLRSAALTLSASFCCIAFWIQPFIRWPDVLLLESQLLPAAILLFFLPKIWNDSQAVRLLRTTGSYVFLGILIIDAFHTAQLADALIIEGICFLAFVSAFFQKALRRMQANGAVLIGVALYMTKGFWLSISWWIYLFAAGIGLILLAAHHEMKKR